MQGSQQLVERERRMKRLALASVMERKQNVLTSLKTMTHPDFIRQAEQDYIRMEKEQERLEKDLATIDLSKAAGTGVD